MAKARLIYWDTCIFLDAIQQTPEWKEILQQIVLAAESGDVLIVTSAVTLAEVINDKKSGAKLPKPEMEKIIAGVFDNEYVAVRPLDTDLATKARIIARDHGLHPMDAIHVATAVDAKVSVMHTRDGDGKARKRGILKRNLAIGNPPLSITVPTWARQMQLVGEDKPDEETT